MTNETANTDPARTARAWLRGHGGWAQIHQRGISLCFGCNSDVLSHVQVTTKQHDLQMDDVQRSQSVALRLVSKQPVT